MRTRFFDLTLLVIVATLARLAFLVVFGGLDNELHDSMTDQFIYLDIATNLAQGEGFVVSEDIWIADAGTPTSIMPPLYPTLLGGLFAVTGPSLLAARIVSLVLAGVLVAIAYLIGHRLCGRRGALLAGGLAALYPPLVMYVRPIMSETIFFPLIALLVYLSMRLLDGEPSRWVWIAWGAVAGLSVLTRTEAGLLVVALAAFIVIVRWRPFKTVPMVLAVVTFLVVLSPYSLYNVSAHGSVLPLPNAKWKMWDHTWWADARTKPEWQGVTLPERIVVPDWDEKTERERDAVLWSMTTDFVRDHPLTYIKQRVRRATLSYPILPLEELREPQSPDGADLGPTSLDDVVRYSTPAEKIRVWSFRLVFALGLLGFLWGYRSDRRILLLGIVVAWNVLHSGLFVGSERLRLQIDLFLVILATAALVAIWRQVVMWWRSRSAMIANERFAPRL